MIFEHGLNAAVNKLRFALGDAADRPRYIATVPRRGYRFIGSVDSDTPRPASALPVVVGQHPPGRDPIRWPRIRHSGWFNVVAVFASALVLGFVLWNGGSRASDESAARTRLVVLPFENLSGDRDQDYFAEGLTDDLITRLGQLDPDRLAVIARTSAAIYGGARRISDVAHDLRVDFIVEGSVRRDAGRVRVSAQLIRAADEAHVWADSYDRDLRDLLAVQGDLARAIANRVDVSVRPLASRRLRGEPRPNPDAYEAYLRGRYLLARRTGEALATGHAYLEQAVRLDPQFARGYAALSRGYQRLAGEMMPPAEAMSRALDTAERSLELEPDLAEGHAARAMIFASYTWDWAAAEGAFRRALDLAPQSVETRIAYASYLSHVGRLDEAVDEADPPRQIRRVPEPALRAGRRCAADNGAFGVS